MQTCSEFPHALLQNLYMLIAATYKEKYPKKIPHMCKSFHTIPVSKALHCSYASFVTLLTKSASHIILE